ncbi:hypothetical protein [Pyxidicoccus sp. MSG2]|uniref:hypothetical protein n=1 Tax=Pyxidicoccus sp. MSG2 TaxID=2996790 RepID=UPI00226F7695|nr:hypothetical protein [Pyxidicoccus sp. MSG2]MCY1019254.1 hypothetical protein [Pyxidicoccus sp. MSG2]
MPRTFMTQALWVPLATLALGVGLGLTLNRSVSPPTSGSEEVLRLLEGQQALLETLPARLAAQAGSQQVQCAAAQPSGSGADLAALRTELAQLREELALARGEQPAPPRPPPEPPAETLVAQKQGHQLIEEASRSGRWRTEDAHTLRQLLITMDDSQRGEVMRSLIVQLNEGKLKSEAQGPIF